MQTIQVDGSSNIRSIAHGGDKLVVEFNTGSKYQYSGVSVQVFRDFQDATSKGEFFAANIKGNPNYPSQKL